MADSDSVHLESTKSRHQKRAKLEHVEDSSQASNLQQNTEESRFQRRSKVEDRGAKEGNESNAGLQNETEQSELSSTKMTVVEKVGDLFDAPDQAVLIHACNCIGLWGAGIAAAFKTRYPEAFIEYRKHCKSNDPENLNGSALLIPPLEEEGPRHFIGCLFTSKRPGKGRDSPEEILGNTEPAMIDLMRQIALKPEISEIRMCHINSGLFNVPWEHTKSLIEKLDFKENVPHTISAWVPAWDP